LQHRLLYVWSMDHGPWPMGSSLSLAVAQFHNMSMSAEPDIHIILPSRDYIFISYQFQIYVLPRNIYAYYLLCMFILEQSIKWIENLNGHIHKYTARFVFITIIIII
jgi:hypothetical protein